MNEKPIILPYDGFKNADNLLQEIDTDLQDLGILEMLSFIKVNDVVFMPPFSAVDWIVKLSEIIDKYARHMDVGIFLDLKLADTSGTLKNIATHFAPFQQKILTVRSNLSGKGYLEIRRALPDVKIALVSFLTDNSEQDCLEQYGLFPEEKILHDMRIAQRKYERCHDDDDPQFAFDMVVCSPKEVAYLKRNELSIFNKSFEYILPGIRDQWMDKGQQVRATGVAEALIDGGDYVVMGSQMKKGNPKKGISAKESQRLTKIEIDRALSEKRGV
ncbi:orotidine 5'-phosphate decarboxylase [Candidatus Parcubacteria bacterium]|nr:orotidine 5'-phosphate decarboxylase [Candidatus Parcubacteria bacterium]